MTYINLHLNDEIQFPWIGLWLNFSLSKNANCCSNFWNFELQFLLYTKTWKTFFKFEVFSSMNISFFIIIIWIKIKTHFFCSHVFRLCYLLFALRIMKNPLQIKKSFSFVTNSKYKQFKKDWKSFENLIKNCLIKQNNRIISMSCKEMID